MTIDPLIEGLARKLGPPLPTTSQEVRFNCVFGDCEDTHFHMYVNPRKEKWFCQKCRRGGPLENLYKILRLPLPENNIRLWDSVINSFLYGHKEEEKVLESASWPIDYNPMLPGTEAHRYLLSRGVSEKKIEYYKIGIGSANLAEIPKEDQWRYAGGGRIIFPDFDENGDIAYWVARTYRGHHSKYKNASVSREDKIFNFGNVKALGYKRRVVLVEGPLDAVCAGYDTLGLYGKYFTGTQISMLVNWKAEEYVVAFDGDALGTGVSLATCLHRRGAPVKFLKFASEDDPASVGSKIRRMIHNAFAWTEFSAMEVLG